MLINSVVYTLILLIHGRSGIVHEPCRKVIVTYITDIHSHKLIIVAMFFMNSILYLHHVKLKRQLGSVCVYKIRGLDHIKVRNKVKNNKTNILIHYKIKCNELCIFSCNLFLTFIWSRILN